MKPELPVWRSLLYVPANVEKYVDRAHTRGAGRHAGQRICDRRPVPGVSAVHALQ